MSSSSSRWQRLEALFYQALELKPEERAAFLEKSCADDADLRKEIQELLNSSEKPMELLQESVVEAAQQMVAAERRRVIAPGTQLAQYTVISMLGAGGMGEVYLAEDTRLGRKVALKLLAPRTHAESARIAAIRTGSARGIGAEPPQHSDHLRVRGGERVAFYRLGICRWRDGSGKDGGGRNRSEHSRRDRHPDRQRAFGGALTAGLFIATSSPIT